MQTLQYEINNIKNYELDIWQSGMCSALAKIKIIDNTVLWDKTDCINVVDYIKTDRTASVTERTLKLLSAARKIVESVSLARDYIIEENSISMEPERIWFRAEDRKAILLPEYYETDFLYNLCQLLNKLDGQSISKQILIRNSESALSYKTLLRFLSSWELDLRQ